MYSVLRAITTESASVPECRRRRRESYQNSVLPSSGGSFDATLPSTKHGHSQDTTTAVGATSDLDSPLYRSRISAASQCRCK